MHISLTYISILIYNSALTKSSWSTVLITGRSSDLSVNTLFPLPKKSLNFSVSCNTELFSYSDGFVQDSHLLPFSPDQQKQ